MGRQPQPGTRPRRLAAKPADLQLPPYSVGTPLYLPFRIYGKHSASPFRRQMARQCEDVDCLHLPDTAWQREANYCSPPWAALSALCAKIHQSGAIATVIAPYCPHKPWFQHLHNMATETIHYPASRNLFPPGRHGSREGVGRP
jgi:hypothetical protein